MVDGTTWQATLASLPALAALVKAVWPRERGLHRALRRNLDALEKMPPGPGRVAMERLVDNLAREVSHAEESAAKKRWSGSGIAAVVTVAVVCGAIAFGLWQIERIVAKIGTVVFVIISMLFIGAGLPTMRETAATYRFEEKKKPEDG